MVAQVVAFPESDPKFHQGRLLRHLSFLAASPAGAAIWSDATGVLTESTAWQELALRRDGWTSLCRYAETHLHSWRQEGHFFE